MQARQEQPLQRERFTARYLEPVDRLAEVVYGVLIVLTFTLAYRGIDARYGAPEGIATAVQRMLLAAIGCAIAWGLIDGVMYILTSMFERSQNQRLLVDIQKAPDERSAVEMVGDTLEDTVGAVLTDEERAQLSVSIYQRFKNVPPTRIRVTRDDVLGAIAVFMLAVVATLPVAIPYLFVDDPYRAIRLSNLIAIVMLFVVGAAWARYTNAPPLRMGLLLAGIGLAMVLIAIPLGG
jgi:VIT1/CCC1 family predicted Fe2+/Mn2+ transporter